MKASKKNIDPIAANFEQAIERLEKIVADMEIAELPLEDVLKKYEEGTRLVQFCGQKLDEAEKKIELLQKKANGTVSMKPFDTEEADEAEDEDRAGGDDDNEAKLF